MTPLKKILIEEISANGPMKLADYMKARLPTLSTAITCNAAPLARALLMAVISSPRRKSAKCSEN